MSLRIISDGESIQCGCSRAAGEKLIQEGARSSISGENQPDQVVSILDPEEIDRVVPVIKAIRSRK